MIDADLLNDKFDFELSKIFIGFLGLIESFDKDKMEAKVKPLVKVKNKDEFIELPVIFCPVNTWYSNKTMIIPDYQKGDIVELKGNIYPVQNQLKGISENASPLRFNLSNCTVIGGHEKRPIKISPSLKKEGLVICHENGDFFNLKKDEVKIKSKKIILDGDVAVTGDVEVDKDITWMKKSKPVKASKHIHPTPTGPSGVGL
ncbi:MAG TPA: hypothetical protein PK079_26545 [Leptospiraceae bacterium]|nr:hypothetical protein [Leptospiraceae bacterium]HMW08583.1 hypothetical protein [Leptospiraceae bacterium]HMZ66542.1 hypothetical protein [Leptospiraceae bacterium]HNB98546.1 hypothetical protein [Leptospiraceae bacterium]HNC59577.1 hypothetical protein [Leptospiraceae bacterium]